MNHNNIVKVLFVNTVPTKKNGITNVIFNYLSNIKNDGLQLDYMSINEPEPIYREMVENKGGSFYVFQRTGSKLLSYLCNLKNLIKQNHYDAVHLHGNSHTLVLELMAAKMAGCKIRICHVHNTTCNSILLHKVLTLPFNRLCTHRLACGEDAGKWMYGHKGFMVLNNGVDLDMFKFSNEKREEIRSKYGFEDLKVIGHVGGFFPVKNQQFVVNIFMQILKQHKNYRLILIGEGPLLGDIKQLVSSYGIEEKVVFTGGIHNVYDYLNAIDLIVMPSLYEGLPLTLIEQQANGLKCIVADTITKEADKTGNICFVSLNDSVEKWAEKIVETKFDKGRSERSEKACHEILKSGYSISKEAMKLSAYYFDIIRKKN